MKHLLIVEDNVHILSALQTLFERAGYRVSTAEGVESGICLASKDRPELMLLDLGLPDGDGLSLLMRMKALNCDPRATIALSGDESEATLNRCLEAGCRNLLVKPVPIQELVAAVQEL